MNKDHLYYFELLSEKIEGIKPMGGARGLIFMILSLILVKNELHMIKNRETLMNKQFWGAELKYHQ